MDKLLKAENLSYSYKLTDALKEVTVSANRGEMVFIVGPNGSGKTTLLKCLGRILEPRGAVYVETVDIRTLSLKRVAMMFGYVPQKTDITPLTVLDAIMLGRVPYMGWRPDENDMDIVRKLLARLNMEQLAAKMLTELSGGEIQKVVIARALAQQPKILLLDEPTNNLDLANQVEVMRIISNLRCEGIASLITTHDLNLPSIYADKVLMMKGGRIFASGNIEILNEKNIRNVYGVEVEIYTIKGRKVIFPRSILDGWEQYTGVENFSVVKERRRD